MMTLKVCGKDMFVDDDLYEQIKCNTFNLHSNGTARTNGSVFVHNLVLPPKEGYVIDHIDRNQLNNQRSNLRYATYAENRLNSGDSDKRTLPPRVYPNGSGFIVQVQWQRILFRTKTFKTVEEATKAAEDFHKFLTENNVKIAKET